MGEIRVPDSLLPENIMATVEQKIKKEKRKKRRRKIAIISTVSAAAAVALIAGVYFRFFNKNFGEEEGSISGLNKIKSYQALYNYLRVENSLSTVGVPKGDAVSDSDMSNMVPEGEATNNGDYSDTNIQTQGIDEGDIVKTDGEYIYVIKNDINVSILKADGENTKKVSEVNLNDIIYKKYGKKDIIEYNIINEIYIYNDMLTVISDCDDSDGMTYVVTAAVKDGEINDIKVMRQKGGYYDSRMTDGILYLLTEMYICIPEQVEDVIGTVNDKNIKPEDTLYTSIDEYGNDYFIMSSIDTMADMKVLDSKAYIGKGIQMYVSGSSIYFMETNFVDETGSQKTKIIKFSFDKGNIEPIASGCVEGRVRDSFSADEYNGYLRVVTTERFLGNNLYVLNEKLEIVGSITGLAAGEEIKSSRFMGDTGYFVTYRNTDPLFTVDLSEPENPKITDELKITGYSAYLHFMDKDNLLGIGYESDPVTGIEEGIKVTLFDVKDKSDVKVKKNLKYEGKYKGEHVYTDAVWSHKAVMASDSKGIYGFCLYTMDYELICQYKVFLYEAGDIREVESIKIEVDYDNRYMIRGLYIGDYFYIINNDTAYVYSLNEVLGADTAKELLRTEY